MLSEISQKERKIPYDMTYMWNLKYDTNEPICEMETLMDIENRLLLLRGRGLGEGWSGKSGLADVNFYI